jgi:hypothetical protein
LPNSAEDTPQILTTGADATLCVRFNAVGLLSPVHKKFELFLKTTERSSPRERVTVKQVVSGSKGHRISEELSQCFAHFAAVADVSVLSNSGDSFIRNLIRLTLNTC